MSEARWKKVTKSKPCPACGKPDWCAWTPDGEMLKCERSATPPAGMVLVTLKDGGALFKYPSCDGGAAPCTRPAAPKGKGGSFGKVVEAYPYRDASGALLFEVVRFDPKGFRQRRPDGKGGWIWSLGDTPRVLYRLPELLAADKAGWVFVCEGEKDVDNVRALGLTATCNPGGAGKWGCLADDSALHGRRVAIIPDRDAPGKKYAGQRHAQDVAACLHGKAADVRVLDLPGDGKDASDWLDANDAKEPADLAKALVQMAESAPLWTPASAAPDSAVSDSTSSPVVVCMADVRPEPVRWLWPSRIALGKLTVIAGDPGLGKSFLTLDMAARVTKGTAWPDAPGVCTTPGGVVLLSAEDDPGDTIRPRLDAASADVTRIMLLKAVRENASDGGKARTFNLAEDLDALETAIASADGCRMVVVDPISAYLGQTDSHRNSDVRALLAPLSVLAAQCGVAVVAVTHLRKGEGAAIYRAMGSLAFVAAARAVYAVGADPNDESGARRLVLPVKNNLGNDRSGLAYRLVADEGAMPHGVWESDPVTIQVDDILSALSKRPGPTPDVRDGAAEWLRVELASGPRPSKELLKAGAAEGHSKRTLQRAKETLGVIAKKTRFDGHWTWELPEGIHQARTPTAHTDNLATLGEPGALGESPNDSARSGPAETTPKTEERQERQDAIVDDHSPEATT